MTNFNLSSGFHIGCNVTLPPEVDGLVYIENDGHSKAGDIVRVKVLAGFVYDLAAERID